MNLRIISILQISQERIPNIKANRQSKKHTLHDSVFRSDEVNGRHRHSVDRKQLFDVGHVFYKSFIKLLGSIQVNILGSFSHFPKSNDVAA